MEFVPLTEYASEQLRAGVSVDGPCLMPDGTFALFISLRGKGGGALPSPSELQWGRDVPDKMRAAAAHLFLRRDREERSATYLGKISFVRTGRPARDGFRILFRLSEPLPETTWRELVAAATAPPPPFPEEAIAALTADSTTAERVAAMRVFIERWYEPAAESPTAAPNAAAATLPMEAPWPLRELHELTARRKLLFGQNTLVSAPDLAVEDGKMVFYIENQGVCVWAIEPGGDDPIVFVRGNSSGAPWVQEAPTLSGFLIQAVILETVFSAPFFGASTDGASAAVLRKLKRHVKPIASAWSDKTEFLGSNGIVGLAYPDAGFFHIDLAAHDREPFEAIEDMLSDWPEIGF